MSSNKGIATRPAHGPDDIRACVDLFFESSNDLHARLGVPVVDPADDGWIRKALTHLERTDPGGTRLALHDGEPVAFGSAFRREDYWFLAFLFVAPRMQARGVGRRVLEELLPPAEERARTTLATVVESIQPASTALYASLGMAPRTPWYTLKAPKRPDALPEMPPGVTAVSLTGELLDACAVLDRRLLGYTRAQDLASWAAEYTARGYVDEHGSLLGYGLLDDGWMSPVASDSQPLTAAIIRDLITRLDSPAEAKVLVPGCSGPLIASCLHAGMQMDREHFYPDVYCSDDGRLPDPAYAPYAAFQP
jgi:GNAT superfamily N-acetyltransferase